MDWDARYAAAGAGLFGEAPNAYLTMICARADFTARSMLLLADGDGRNGTWAAGRGLSVTGVDGSGVATELARDRDRKAGVTAERVAADLADWTPSPGRQWEAAAILFLQGPPQLRRRTVSLAAAAVGPGGWIILEGFARRKGASTLGPSGPDRRYTIAEVLDSLAGWSVIEAVEGRVLLDEGPSHQGEAAVVRVAARKPR